MFNRFLFLCFFVSWNINLFSQECLSSTPLQQKVSVFDKAVEFSGWSANDKNTVKVNDVRIGLFFPLNPESRISISVNNAADLAVEEINKSGGYNGLPYRLIKRWSNDPWGAGSKEMIRLVYEDSVWAVIGSLDGAATHVAEQIATKAWVPLISPVSADPTLNYIRIPWIFRLPPDYQTQARTIVNEGLKKQSIDKVGLITTTNHDGRIFADEVQDAIKDLNKALLFYFQISERQENLKDIVERTLNFKPDAVVIHLTEKQINRYISELRDNGYLKPVFVPLIPESEFEILSESYNRNLFYVKSLWQSNTPEYVSFKNKYYKRFGINPSASAAYTYDAVYLLAHAIEKAGLNRPAIRDAVYHTDYYHPLTGKISWDNTGGNISQTRLIQMSVQ